MPLRYKASKYPMIPPLINVTQKEIRKKLEAEMETKMFGKARNDSIISRRILKRQFRYLLLMFLGTKQDKREVVSIIITQIEPHSQYGVVLICIPPPQSLKQISFLPCFFFYHFFSQLVFSFLDWWGEGVGRKKKKAKFSLL